MTRKTMTQQLAELAASNAKIRADMSRLTAGIAKAADDQSQIIAAAQANAAQLERERREAVEQRASIRAELANAKRPKSKKYSPETIKQVTGKIDRVQARADRANGRKRKN